MRKNKQWNQTEEQSVRAHAPASSDQQELEIRMMLRDVRHCHLRTLTLCERAEKYREMAMQATGRADVMRVSGTPGQSKVEKYVMELWETHNELQQEIARLMDKSREAEKLILRLKDERHRAVLELRYLCGLTWDELAEKLHFTLRWVHTLHNNAIDELVAMGGK